jgi:hypothetical protein
VSKNKNEGERMNRSFEVCRYILQVWLGRRQLPMKIKKLPREMNTQGSFGGEVSIVSII